MQPEHSVDTSVEDWLSVRERILLCIRWWIICNRLVFVFITVLMQFFFFPPVKKNILLFKLLILINYIFEKAFWYICEKHLWAYRESDHFLHFLSLTGLEIEVDWLFISNLSPSGMVSTICSISLSFIIYLTPTGTCFFRCSMGASTKWKGHVCADDERQLVTNP